MLALRTDSRGSKRSLTEVYSPGRDRQRLSPSRERAQKRAKEAEPKREDAEVWGDIFSPPPLKESPVHVTLLCLAIVALTFTAALFGLLVYAGPWCNCGRGCAPPTSIPNAVLPLCHDVTIMEHGSTCDLECQPGYVASSDKFMCVDAQISPVSATCTLAVAGADIATSGTVVVGGTSIFSGPANSNPISFGCEANNAQPIVGTCFKECNSDMREPDNDFNMWSITSLRFEDGWKPPNKACCQILHESCRGVNARISYRQFIATSETAGVCNLACVPLPPDAIQYAKDVVERATQPPATTTPPPVVDTTTVDPATLLAEKLSAMDGETTTPGPVNQTEYWKEYDKNNGPTGATTLAPNTLVSAMSPECFLGLMLSPMCILFLVLFVLVTMCSCCMSVRLCQNAAKERWPSKENEGGLRLFHRCTSNVKSYEKPSIKPGLPGKKPPKPSRVRKASEHSIKPFKTYETKIGPGDVDTRSQGAMELRTQTSMAMTEASIGSSDEISEAYGYLSNDIILNCEKKHGLFVKQDDSLLCTQCGYGVVRYVPYKSQLEVVEFYCCRPCKFSLCFSCASQMHNRVVLKAEGVVDIAKHED